MLRLLLELIRKDFLVFSADRKAMIITFAVPIGIASFLGTIMGNIAGGGGPAEIPLLVVNQDQASVVSKSIVDEMSKSKNLKVQLVDLKTAQSEVHDGRAPTAVVLSSGFGEAAVKAISDEGPKPELQILSDPGRSMETQAAKGMIYQVMVSVISKQASGGLAPMTLPFNVQEQSGPGEKSIPWSGSAHAFAGLGVQALFFGAMETAMGLMKDRRMGIWSRLRASPVNRHLLLLAKFLGSTLLAFLVLLVVFTAGALMFGYRITGSYAGFLIVALSIGAMSAGAGLFIAALGRTEQQSRGLSILVILVMLMLGGAWMPIGFLPGWIQTISLFTPVRWAVDGIDFMTWKGGSFVDALRCATVLFGFALGLLLIAARRFRWSAEGA
jgi:ABC-2 type transport system permease protein